MLSGEAVAGKIGTQSDSDNSVGTNARLQTPHSVRADMVGGLLYVADRGNQKVRTVTIGGTQTVDTLISFSDFVREVAPNPAARVLYVAVGPSVQTVTYAGTSKLLAGSSANSYADGTGAAARFSDITGLALDAAAGLLFVADDTNHRIRCITTGGGVVTTIAGSGTPSLVNGVGSSAAFNGPIGIAVDPASGALYVSDNNNHVIRQIQLPMPIPVTLIAPPLPPSPLASNHQLVSWRALGSAGAGTATPLLDARSRITFLGPLSATNTAGLNPVIRTLLLGSITLAPRNAAPAATGNTNTTFSTSAQRGLRFLTLTAPAVPAAALALPALTNLTLTAAVQPQLAAGSLDGLGALTCLNCGGVVGLANLSGLRIVSDLLTQPLALPLITTLDASATGISAVYARSFDGMTALRVLSLAGSNLSFVSDAAFTGAKQPVLVTIDQSRTPLLSGNTCPPGTYYAAFHLAASGALYFACATCPVGTSCAGGAALPVSCAVNTYAAAGAAACVPCPTGTYADDGANKCTLCSNGVAAATCTATATWRNVITLVAGGAGSWVGATIYLAPAGSPPAGANAVVCGALTTLSTSTVSCALPFLLPPATTAPVLTHVWVTHAGTGGVPQRVAANVTLVPPPPVVVAAGGGIGLAPLTAGHGRVVLQLPAPRLTVADWVGAGLPPPPQATIDGLSVWLGGVPCSEPVWETSTTLSCVPATTGAPNVAAVVQLAGGVFNVSGVLPSLLQAPALAASMEVRLLPPASTAVNITLAGVALCAGGGGVPQLASASVAGVPCAAIACAPGRTDAALCVGWDPSSVRTAGSPQAAVNVSVAWVSPASRPVFCAACVTLASRPVLTSITPTSVAAPGVPVVLTGTGFTGATHVPPTVLIGDEVCGGVMLLSQTVLQCTAPPVLSSAPGYPVVAVVVINAAGAASTESVNLTYPTTFAVSWETTPAATALPGGLFLPAPTLRVVSRQAATCTLAINVSSCATTNPALASRSAGMSVSTPATSLSVGASDTPAAVPTDLYLDALIVAGASGCAGSLMATCIDAVGETASTAGQPNPAVALASWRGDWTSTNVPTVVVPAALPDLTAVFSLVGSGGVLTVTSATSLSCLALLLPASVAPPSLSQSLDRVSSRDVLSSVSGVVALINGSAAGIAIAGLTASASRLGQALALYAECTWVPTGERLRMPTLPLAVANVTLALTPATSLLVEAYESSGVAAVATMSPAGVANFAGADARCTWRTMAATSSSIVLAAASSAASWTLDANGVVGGGQPLALTVEGSPGATLTLQLVCSLWGAATVASPPLNVTTRAYTVTLCDGVGVSTVRAVWPSGTQALLALVPAIAVTVPARNVLTCGVSIAGMSARQAATAPGVGLGLSDGAVQLVGEPSISVVLESTATRANVSLSRVGLHTAGGTNASLMLTCRDGVGRSAALGAPINVSVAALSATWSTDTVAVMPSVVVPSQALPALTLTVISSPAVPLPPDTDVTSLLLCAAGIFRASTPLPLSTPLAALVASASPIASFSTSTTGGATITTGADNASIVVTMPPLSTTTCPLATQLTVAAECTWTPTGERVRLPLLVTSTLKLTLAWAAPPAIVLAYTPMPLYLTATIGAPATGSSGAATTATCEVLLVNATVRSARLAADAWSLELDGSASSGTIVPSTATIAVQAPPATQLFVKVSCTAWGQVLSTTPLRLTTASLEARITSPLPSTFIASDASSPWPLEPPLVVAVVTRHNNAVVADVTCSVTASTPATDLVVVDDASALTSLRTVPADAHTGIVAVPQFVVQTSPATRNVTLVVECQHLASGDALPPLSATIPATLLAVQQCTAPVTTAAVGDPLPAFSVGVSVAAPDGVTTLPCESAVLDATQQPIALPPIVCTIAQQTSNATASVFLQHTAVVVAADSHIASFDAFTLVAPQGQTYGLSLTCAVGGLAIPPALTFNVEISGCRPGQASESVTCVTCGGGEFSLGGKGAKCTGCPPAGATCVGGILTLLPHYFRPPSQGGMPLGPDTELHPCHNSEACTLTLNGSDALYGCSPGYTGPLCGVCDAAANYARFGDACDVCWAPGASAFFLSVVFIVVLALLAHVALFSEVYNKYPDDAIVLRIALGYLQGVGSLRVFVAGSTQAYANLMGWTEVVSASPLSMGALQCLLPLSYFTQYAFTVLLPVLASAVVIAIFLVGTTARSVHCELRRAAPSPVATTEASPQSPSSPPPTIATRIISAGGSCTLDSEALRGKLTTWWASKRHISTLLFVLFLTYMPITSVSLRVLDCIPPVAGVRYLRSNLSVECGVGEHAAARVLAYFVLLAVGIGFPAGRAWLLGTARKEQLLDTGVHATWGFLFDGYRAPTRKLVTKSGDDDKSLPVTDSGGTGSTPTETSTAPTPDKHGRLQKARQTSLRSLTQAWVVEGDSRVWWEALVLGRKAGVVLLAVLVTNPYMQCVGATLWFFGAILLQLKYAPYEKTKFNRLELATLTVTFFTAVVSTALLQFNVDVATADLHAPAAMAPIEWAVTIVLGALNTGMLATLCYLWLRVQWDRARTIWRALPLRRASSVPAPAQPPPLKTMMSPLTFIVGDSGSGGGVAFAMLNPLRTGSLPPAANNGTGISLRRLNLSSSAVTTTTTGGDSKTAHFSSTSPLRVAVDRHAVMLRTASSPELVVALPSAPPTHTVGMPPTFVRMQSSTTLTAPHPTPPVSAASAL